MLIFSFTISDMKKETGILLAGTIGVIIGLTIFGVRKFLAKKRKEYDDYYLDFHRHFERGDYEDSNDGIEFLAVK